MLTKAESIGFLLFHDYGMDQDRAIQAGKSILYMLEQELKPNQCHCAATSTVLCDYCAANLCERCTEAPDLCECPDDGAPEHQWQVTAPTSPEREFEAEWSQP